MGNIINVPRSQYYQKQYSELSDLYNPLALDKIIELKYMKPNCNIISYPEDIYDYRFIYNDKRFNNITDVRINGYDNINIRRQNYICDYESNVCIKYNISKFMKELHNIDNNSSNQIFITVLHDKI